MTQDKYCSKIMEAARCVAEFYGKIPGTDVERYSSEHADNFKSLVKMYIALGYTDPDSLKAPIEDYVDESHGSYVLTDFN